MKKLKLIIGSVCSAIIVFLVLNNSDDDYVRRLSGITYEFTGQSEHFTFSDGKVYFSDYMNELQIEDFKQIKKIDKLKIESMTVMFDNEEEITIENTDNLNKLNKKVEGLGYFIGNYANCERDSGECEWSEFNLATEENFKEVFSVKINYCTTDHKCSEEIMEIIYKY